MRKLTIVLCAVALLVVIAIFVICFRLFSVIGKGTREVREYTPSVATQGEKINEKMNSILGYTAGDVISELSVKRRVILSELGVAADNFEAADENSRIIRNAINSAFEGTELVLPEGKVFIREGFELYGKKDLRIVGKDTVLVNTGYSPMKLGIIPGDASRIFNIAGCRNIHLEGFKIDYAKPATAEGIITKISGGKVYFELLGEYSEEYKTLVEGGEAVFSVLVANDGGFYNEIWPQEGTQLSKEEGELEFSVPASIGKVGDRICCRISCGNVASPAIFVANTSGLELRDIGCFSCPSAFFYATVGNSNFVFSGLDIAVSDKGVSMLASNEDCIHIKQLSGKLLLEDCSFEGIGDDALNIHTKLCEVKAIEGNKVTIGAGGSTEPFPNGFFLKGETAEFFGASGKSLGIATVKNTGSGFIVLDKLPEGVKAGTLIQNVSTSPDVLVKNCTVRDGRARGVLLQAKNAVISGCTFENLRLSAILASPDFTYWYEGGFADNLLVTGNRFVNCTNAASGNGFGVVSVITSHDEVRNNVYLKGHKNVTVTDNVFESCRGKKVVVTSTHNQTVEN